MGQPSHKGLFLQDSMIKGLRTLPWWKSSEANHLDGWDTQYPPNHKVGWPSVLRRWLGPLNRIGTIIYEKDVIMHKVKLNRFVWGPKVTEIRYFQRTRGGGSGGCPEILLYVCWVGFTLKTKTFFLREND